MKSSTRLESAVFQLTPTRTRFDLVITANGKSERIASGLLNPFLAHLKSAQEQIGRGGYSVILETNRGSDAAWFTKGTVEMFVRFVNTPEILERVYTIESEMSQIEEAISFQRNIGAELHGVQGYQVNCKERDGSSSRNQNGHVDAGKSGSKTVMFGNEEKAIVLYKLDTQGGKSKTQLLRVLETRKGVLQKEQGMAFARALAAGFDIDHISPLLSFAECFGATRMMEACSRFVELWKAKHESGQWVEAVEAISRVDFASVNSFSVPNSNDIQRGVKDSWVHDEMPSQNNDMNAQINSYSIQPNWPPAHPQAGQMAALQPYPLPIPFYQNYPGNSSLKMNTELAIYHESGIKEESQREQARRKKGGKSARKQSGTVVIRNINYIASKKQQSSDSGSESSATSGEYDDVNNDVSNKNLKRSKQEENGDAIMQLNREDNDNGHWQAFQTLLLRNADEEDNSRALGSIDPSIISKKQNLESADNHVDMQFAEMGPYRRTGNGSDELTITRRDMPSSSSSNPFAGEQFGYRNGDVDNRTSTYEMGDESFIVPYRSNSIDQVGSEHPLNHAGSDNLKTAQSVYEPYDLNMMPVRSTENGTLSLDAAMDYELQAAAKVDNGAKKSADVKKVVKSQKKTNATVTKKGVPTKLSPAEEARARAEKLRSYKADLQKQKKAKEEEQLKRLEGLKMERQKRIAARSSSGGASSHSTKVSPVSRKGSKFSDTEPGSSSPLQRSTVKTISRLTGEAHKFSTMGRLDFGAHSGGNRLTRSASPRKEENNASITPGSKAPSAKFRRLSEPKISSYPASSFISPTQKSLSRRTPNGPTAKSDIEKSVTRSASSLSERKEEKDGSKSRIKRLSMPKGSNYIASPSTPSSEKPQSRRTPKGSEMRKTPAIVKSEIIKTEAVPESNIKESKSHSNLARKRSVINEPTEKMNMKINCTASSSLIGEKSQVLSKSNFEEKTVVEKSVVMLESEEKICIQTVKPVLEPSKGITSETVADCAQIVPSSVKEDIDKTVEHKLRKASPTTTNKAENVPEKPYNAPYARVSSLEHPCTERSEYAKAPPVSLDTVAVAARSELPIARVSSSMTEERQHKLDKIWEVAEKPPTEKESPRGFKRLLKFAARKKHGSSTESSQLDLDKTNHDEPSQESASSSAEVTTLKELISQGEGSMAAQTTTTPQKSSRSFSLLSPFRSKAS